MRFAFKSILALGIVSGLVGILVLSCSPPQKQLQRITSPDHIVDAVLSAKLVNATVATPYMVYIVPAGSHNLTDPVLVGDDFVGLKLIWKAPRFLVIQFSKGEIFKFSNLWMSKKVQDFRYLVEIRLRPLSERSIPSWDEPRR